MQDNFIQQMRDYLSDPKNRNFLRQCLFNLEDYRLRIESDEELTELRTKYETIINESENQHRSEIQRLNQDRKNEIDRLNWDHGETIHRLKMENQENLQRSREDHQKEFQQLNERYQRDLSNKQWELDNYRAEVADRLRESDENKKELEQWRESYGSLEDAYGKFFRLSSKHKDSIAGIFGGCDNPIDFFCGALQKGHLDQLWDYIGDELKLNDTNDEENDRLVALFDFAFDAVNRSQREPLFNRLNPQIGSRFDSETMGRDNESPQNGNVSQLIFAGYSHAVTGEIVKRSSVRLE